MEKGRKKGEEGVTRKDSVLLFVSLFVLVLK